MNTEYYSNLEGLLNLLSIESEFIYNFCKDEEFKNKYTIMMEGLRTIYGQLNKNKSMYIPYDIRFNNGYLQFDYPEIILDYSSDSIIEKRNKCMVYKDFKTMAFIDNTKECWYSASNYNIDTTSDKVMLDVYEFTSNGLVHLKEKIKNNEDSIENRCKAINERKKVLKK